MNEKKARQKGSEYLFFFFGWRYYWLKMQIKREWNDSSEIAVIYGIEPLDLIAHLSVSYYKSSITVKYSI